MSDHQPEIGDTPKQQVLIEDYRGPLNVVNGAGGTANHSYGGLGKPSLVKINPSTVSPSQSDSTLKTAVIGLAIVFLGLAMLFMWFISSFQYLPIPIGMFIFSSFIGIFTIARRKESTRPGLVTTLGLLCIAPIVALIGWTLWSVIWFFFHLPQNPI